MNSTKNAKYVWYCPKQLYTYCYTKLRNGMRISSDAWWLFVRLCGIDAVDQMMAEPDFYPA